MSARRFAGEVAALAGAGLGLRKGALRLERTTGGHVEAGEALARAVAAGVGAAVEHVGSTAVVGLLAKPIVDLAVAWPPDAPLEALHTTLAGWSYQGDSGDQGGHLFVLESEPWVRVSHLHAVDAGGRQWRRYLTLRDHLRGSAEARARYEATKLELIERHGADRRAYTDGKTATIEALCDAARWGEDETSSRLITCRG